MGGDQGTFYAHLTPNGVPDDDGPHVWITPPRFVIENAPDLARAIGAATEASVDDVVLAMRRGANPGDRQALEQMASTVPAEPTRADDPARRPALFGAATACRAET